MRFKFSQLHSLLDAQANFEQIEQAFSPPTFAAAPSNPTTNQIYYDSTLNQMGYWNSSTHAWVYW